MEIYTREEFEKEKDGGRKDTARALLRIEKKKPVFLAFVAIYDWD